MDGWMDKAATLSRERERERETWIYIYIIASINITTITREQGELFQRREHDAVEHGVPVHDDRCPAPKTGRRMGDGSEEGSEASSSKRRTTGPRSGACSAKAKKQVLACSHLRLNLLFERSPGRRALFCFVSLCFALSGSWLRPQASSSPDYFTVTTPLFYANAAPHMGSAYPTMAADALARYHVRCLLCAAVKGRKKERKKVYSMY